MLYQHRKAVEIHQHSLILFSQLCYLHADLFKTLSAKETKKQFVEFYNTFLDKGAVSSSLHCIL